MEKKETQHIHGILSPSAEQMKGYNWHCRMTVFERDVGGDLAFHASREPCIICLATIFGMAETKKFMDKSETKIYALILLPNPSFFFCPKLKC